MVAIPSRSAITGPRDGDVVRRVAAGSEAALADLYDKYAASVFRVALSVTRDQGAAEEVVQETFLTLWNRAELFDPELGSLGVWLSTIARNRAIDQLRSRGRHAAVTTFSTLTADRPDPAATVEWLVESGQLIASGAPDPEPEIAVTMSEPNGAVAAAIVGLTSAERQAILLAYRDGLTQPEIAAQLGWPLGTVKTRSRRALRRLREALESGPDGRAMTPPSPHDAALRAITAPEPCGAPC